MYMTHGLTHHPEYPIWRAIRNRCISPSAKAYPSYGGRGIEMAPAWRDSPVEFIRYIEEFLGPRPPGHSLDRIDNDGNYEPGNLRWATRVEQNTNQRQRPIGASGYRGVNPYWGRWRARFGRAGERRILGCFDTPESAAHAYDEAAFAALGAQAHLNFPALAAGPGRDR